MRPLERLGLEVAAYQLLGSRTQAAVLCALIDGRGAPVSWSALATARPWRMDLEIDDQSARNVVKTRICLLRESLEDIGLMIHIDAIPGYGYHLDGGQRECAIHFLAESVK